MTYLSHLQCSGCNRTFDADVVQTYCPECQAPFLARYNLTAAHDTLDRDAFRYRLPAGATLAPLAGLTLDGAKVAEVLMSATRDDCVELLAVTNLDARDRTLIAEDGREAVPVGLPYAV